MGKRSNYEKIDRNYYPTPKAAVVPLKNMLVPVTFCEPCAGDGRLVSHIEELIPGSLCLLATDIEPQTDWILQGDANNLTDETLANCQAIITNPPFTWSILQPLMDKWISLRPTILLLPADFMHNQRMAPYMEKCEWVKSVGRVKWIEDSKSGGMENFVWMCFNKDNTTPTLFFGRDI